MNVCLTSVLQHSVRHYVGLVSQAIDFADDKLSRRQHLDHVIRRLYRRHQWISLEIATLPRDARHTEGHETD